MASKTCVSIGVFSVAKLVSDVKRSLRRSDYAELRLDFLNPSQIPSCLNLVRPHLGRCICTLRPRSEGGKFQGSENERISILKLIAEFEPHLLDVEYNTLRKNKELYQYLKRTGVEILVSWHDFTKTPSEQHLKSMAKKMSRFSKNVKIVTTARTISDTLRVLNLYKGTFHRINLVAFAMGDYGRMSRILCTRLGSPFTYVSLGKPVAPGQFSLDEMKTIFKLQK
ncbi:MAG TPA: type I 3-dehydroquinate dehydratase [Candidatus Nitrosotalea sp.]|nr:type I 3-dehydroquinate dehydratase [Nitrososphaerota archaeon]HKU33516.1 type I 3-dehydroquinate dehydratase [Candidatus Nitrosotalea sp.]